MLADTDYCAFRELVEAQSLRHLRRYLDYGKRARKGSGLTELHRWVGRILLDREAIYDLQDKASAFEIGACEWLAAHWDEVSHPEQSSYEARRPQIYQRLYQAEIVRQRGLWIDELKKASNIQRRL